MARKVLTPDQAATAKDRAVAFLRNVLEDDDRADEIESESVEEWAEETGRRITNPQQQGETNTMAKSKADLEAELDDANSYIEQLEAKLDRVASAIDDGDDSDDDSDSDDDIFKYWPEPFLSFH